jgi:hypothetical protein
MWALMLYLPLPSGAYTYFSTSFLYGFYPLDFEIHLSRLVMGLLERWASFYYFYSDISCFRHFTSFS